MKVLARTLGVLAACAAIALPVVASAQTRFLADGRDWQRSTLEQRRSYLTGVQNTLVVAARDDVKNGRNGTFAQKVEQGLKGTQIERAVLAVDAFYKANPGQLDLPVLTVVWRELAKLPDGPS